VQFSLGARFRDVGFRDGKIDDFKVFDYELATRDVMNLFLASAPELPEQRRQMLLANASTHWEAPLLRGEETYDRLTEELATKRKEQNDWISTVRTVMSMAPAIVPRPTHILERGAYDAPRARVEPHPPERVSGSWKRNSHSGSSRIATR
jgi:hypothetical protein